MYPGQTVDVDDQIGFAEHVQPADAACKCAQSTPACERRQSEFLKRERSGPAETPGPISLTAEAIGGVSGASLRCSRKRAAERRGRTLQYTISAKVLIQQTFQVRDFPSLQAALRIVRA
jgi:hypothetical protein